MSLIRHPDGFPAGYTAITERADAAVGIDFGILKLEAGGRHEGDGSLEEAWLLLEGEATFSYDGREVEVARRSLFDEDPYALHFAAGSEAAVEARGDCELALCRVENERRFDTLLFDGGSMLESEHRGKGLLQDAAYRIVRTIFDGRNRPEARLVLGEVVNFPGRWSSYPPHHHAQPELYHYRFTEPRGYGHCELGDEVLKVRRYDTVRILDGRDHPQVAAPGYGMYYIWVIRHLPGDPYTVPEFTADHRWLCEADARIWEPEL